MCKHLLKQGSGWSSEHFLGLSQGQVGAHQEHEIFPAQLLSSLH